MAEQEQQAVVEEQVEDQAQPEAETVDAQDQGDDLDKLLSEFSSETPKQAEQPEDTNDMTNARLAQVEEALVRADVSKLVSKVRGDIPPEVFDDTDIEGWVEAQARREPKLQKAWVNRHADPAGFDRVAGELGKRLAKKLAKLPDRNATEDREAVTQAVRGSSTKAPEGAAPDYSKMSNQEARAAIIKEHGFDPGF